MEFKASEFGFFAGFLGGGKTLSTYYESSTHYTEEPSIITHVQLGGINFQTTKYFQWGHTV